MDPEQNNMEAELNWFSHDNIAPTNPPPPQHNNLNHVSQKILCGKLICTDTHMVFKTLYRPFVFPYNKLSFEEIHKPQDKGPFTPSVSINTATTLWWR